MNPVSSYFFGITLPETLEAECEKWRRKFKAPKTVAHLTVIPPFLWEAGLQDLIELGETALSSTKPFPVKGEGLGAFGTRVIFVNVIPSPELVTMEGALARALELKGIRPEPRPYHPHITLATRLDPERFHHYREELEEFTPHYSFTCSEVSVFQFSDSRSWQKVAKIALV